MAETLKVLGQVDMPSSALTAIYTVPALAQAVVSTFYVANRTGSSILFRISIAVTGAADDPKQYIYYDITIPPHETFASTTGGSLGAGDVVRGYASATGLSFTVFGAEKT